MFNFLKFYFSDYLPFWGFTGYIGYFIYFIYHVTKYCIRKFSNKTPSSNELRNIKRNLTAQDIVHPVALGVQQGEIYQEVPINESAV